VFTFTFTHSATDDLLYLRKYDQQRVLTAIERQLRYEPDRETKNRKRLRPNQLAEWELRVDLLRVCYDVDVAAAVVTIRVVGGKQGDKLYLRGQEYHL
jgi:mRNA-degrading endonuclease RelE of RelBE toxin-antitoxin system